MSSKTQTSGSDVATLEDYLNAISERKLLVALFALGSCLAVWGLAAARTPSYEATSTVLVGPTPVGSIDGSVLVQPNLERIKSVLSSISNIESAQELINESEPLGLNEISNNIDIVYVPNSDVLDVTYTSGDPVEAANWSNALAESFVTARETQADSFYQSQIDSKNELISASVETIDELDDQISEAQSELSRLRLDPQDNATAIGQAEALLSGLRLDRVEVNVNSRTFVRDLNKAQAALEVRPTAAAVLRKATPPAGPNQIPTKRLAVGGAIFGLFAGIVTAFFLSRLDRRLKTDEEIESTLLAPVLASIPQVPRRHRTDGAAVVMGAPSKSIAARRAQEEYRRLRSSIIFMSKRQTTSVFMITSTRPGEGKSTVVMNLGLALAKSGLNTAIVSADLRRPSLDGLVGKRSTERLGLADWLSGDDSIELSAPTGVDGLTLIPSGTRPANPTELLTSERTVKLFQELRASFDIVLVDTPPVLSTADAGSIVPLIDHVLIVVDTHKSDSDDLYRTREQLMQVGARLIGAARNRKRMTLAQRFGRGRDAYLYSTNEKTTEINPGTTKQTARK